MDKFYPPYFPCYIPLPNGKPAAGGKLYAYFTGTDNLAPLYAEDGTILVGSVADIDSSGQVHVLLDPAITYRLKVVPPVGSQMPDQIYDNVRVANGTIVGMENPMIDQGDMIVGAAAGVPVRLAHPNDIGFLRATLSFGMKVLQWVGLTGTKGIEVTNGGAGTEIGLDTTGASEGDALKIVNGVPSWSTDAEGMQNPMTTAGDLIVGSAGGEPARLGVGTDGDILATASGAPTWEGGPKKYRNVYQNIPSPQIDDGYLGCLFYLSGSAQALTLPSSANVPSKSFIDFVFLDGTATLTITPQGTTTLNEQATAVTIGGQAATLYRLTFLGHGGSGDEWALGGSGNGDHKVSADGTDAAGYLEDKIGAGSGISLATSAGKVVVSASTQPGDHKTAVDGADASPDYLAAKLSAGTGISLTNTGSAVEIAANTQPGDHQLLTTSADTSAGYLASKLVPGANITLTTQTDGDGVQTIEIAAAGGGGGGGSAGAAVWAVHPNIATTQQPAADTSWKTSLHKIFVPKLTPSHVAFVLSYDNSHFSFAARVGIYTASRVLCYYGEASYASAPDYLGLNFSTGEFYSIAVSSVPTAPKTEFENEFVILAISFPSYGSYRPSFLSYNAANSSVRKMTAPITSSMTTLPNPDGEVLTRTPAVGIL